MKKTILICAALSLAISAGANAGSVEEGKKKASACVSCHGMNGKSVNPNNPNLKGQQKNYLIKALKDYRDKKRQDAMMNSLTASLSDADIEDIATYYNSLK